MVAVKMKTPDTLDEDGDVASKNPMILPDSISLASLSQISTVV